MLDETDLQRCAEIRTANFERARLTRIVEDVSEMTEVPFAEIIGNSRSRAIAHARQLAIFVARREGFSYPVIGGFFNRDHTSCIHAVEAETKRRAGK